MINLLPPEIKNRYKVRSKILGLTVIYLLVLAVMGVVIAALFFLNLINQSSVSENETKLATLTNQTKQSDTITDQAGFIEERIKSAGQYAESIKWEDVMSTIASSTPTNIQLTSLKVANDATKNTITISLGGNSPDRRSVILYREKLATQTGFSSPIVQSIADSADQNNQYTFTIQLTYKAK